MTGGTDSSVHAINMGSNGAIKHVESYSVHSVSGPRHIAFHPTTQTVYVLGEIGLTVTTMELASDGALRRVGHPLSIAPKGHSSKAGLNNELGERGLMASGNPTRRVTANFISHTDFSERKSIVYVFKGDKV